MDIGSLALVKAGTAAEIYQHFPLLGAARALAAPTAPPPQFLERLIQHDCFASAIRLLAFGLPRREALWWGCVCLRMTEVTTMSPVAEAALSAAVRWVVEPSEENRWEAQATGKAATIQTAAGFLAWGAFCCGASIAPAGQPVMAPDALFPSEAAAASIIKVASRAGTGASFNAVARRFLTVGVAIANGRYSWRAQDAPASR